MHLPLHLPIAPAVFQGRTDGRFIVAEIAHKLTNLLRGTRLRVLRPRIKCGHLAIPKHDQVALAERHHVVEFDMEQPELVERRAFLRRSVIGALQNQVDPITREQRLLTRQFGEPGPAQPLVPTEVRNDPGDQGA